VELSGELELAQKDGRPRLLGELSAVQGRLLLMGTVFQVERGRAVFDDEADVDPELDISLATYVRGVTIRVITRGRVSEPKLELASDPEMPPSDILSYLLFGKPVDELDGDQTTLLQARALELARNFATQQFEARLERELGMDLVRVQLANGRSKKTSLTVAKYLSRRTLLRYEQDVWRGNDLELNLEYWLTQRLKLESHYSKNRQSGVEMNWSRDY
jgi:translocation and assembly module TamB